MKIKVFNEKYMQTFVTDVPHIVISIQDPNSNFIELQSQESRKGLLQLKFYDVDDISYIPTLSFEPCYLFNETHAKEIVQFIEKYEKDVQLICINCVHGESRSPGVGAALNKIYNGDDKFFFDNYTPNLWAYRKTLKEYYEKENHN